MSSNLKPQDAKALAKEEPSIGDDDLEFSATTTSKLSASQRKALRGDVDEDEELVAPTKSVPVQQVIYQQPPQNVLPLDPADRDARVREEKLKVQMMMKEGEANLKIARERQMMQLASLEKQVTEILVSIKQKTQMIEQDLMRIQGAMKSLQQPQASAQPAAGTPATPAATPPKKVG